MSKIVLIGANHAGIAAANTILDQYPGNKLTIIDSNSNISYLGCGTALWVGKQIKGTEGLFYSSKQTLTDKGASVFMNTAVQRIDFEQKTVHAVTEDGAAVVESYDKLILASGSLPIEPKIPGIKLTNVYFVKLYQDGQSIDQALNDDSVKSVAIVGAGYIGVEIAEAVQRRGKKALLFEAANTTLSSYYDLWFSEDMDKNLARNGIELHLRETIKAIEGNGKVSRVITDRGTYGVEAVVLAIGFRPNSVLGKDKLKLFANGAYWVDLRQQTSDPNVFAIGDCATVWSNALGAPAYIALATNAVRSGIVAAHNVCGTEIESTGVQGSNGICIFDYKMVSTGLNLTAAIKAGFDAAYTDYEDLQKPGFIESDNGKVKLRIVYDKKSRRILGAQMASFLDISMGIHMFSLAIAEKVTIERLALLDIFFLPHFNQPYNYITMAALSAK
ncbi:MAG: FAD-dependent oxidoreductase [Desulfarculales bacterium]|jgi:NADPH-dependent 2,4-dienoyl-CoA reductase/sulfur reductase-like enzyme|nr:FAD-dependent oxidoreductase [Desulfarculales bacterium]